MAKTYDVHNKDALACLYADASMYARHNHIIIKNAHNCSRQWAYTILWWKCRQPSMRVTLETRHAHCLPILAGMDFITELVIPPTDKLVQHVQKQLAALQKCTTKAAVRDWVLAMFAAGVDARDWVPLVEPRGGADGGKLVKSMDSWVATIHSGNTLEQMRQVPMFYVALCRVLGIS